MPPSPSPPGVRLVDVERVEVEIEKLVAGGDGLARWEGVPIFVPRSAPGDRLLVEVVERKPGYGRAEIVEVLEPGPGRREPPCPYFARCGGCDLQHLEDGVQLAAKVAAVRETLERLGGLELPAEVPVHAASPWAYRLRAQLHTRRGEEGPEVGYFQRASRDLVAVDRCPILAPELEAVLPGLPGRLPADPPSRIDVAVGDGPEITSAPPAAGLPRGEVELTVGEHVYRYDARAFFQAHRELVGTLVAEAVGGERGERAVDLYAGVGLFTLPLARRYRRVSAVEGDRIAARFLAANSRRDGADVEVVQRAVESWIGLLPEGTDRVVVDPPRAGLSRYVCDQIARARVGRLTYVSCHPATLARDLRVLDVAYRLERLALVDMFPQTGHMEAVAHLVVR